MAFSIFLGAVLMMLHLMATDAEVKAEIQQQRGGRGQRKRQLESRKSLENEPHTAPDVSLQCIYRNKPTCIYMILFMLCYSLKKISIYW